MQKPRQIELLKRFHLTLALTIDGLAGQERL